MTPELGETIYLDFITSSSTGAATNADSTPSVAVFESNDAAAMAYAPTVAQRGALTGHYFATVVCSAANGFETGKTYNLIASATVGGVAAKSCIGTFQVRNSVVTDVLSGLATQVDLVVYSPATGSVLDLYHADAYQNADGRGITITKSSSETHWPTTLSTVHFTAKPSQDTVGEYPSAASLTNIACTVTQATGGSQALRLELTGAQLATLQAGSKDYDFWLIANKDSNPATLRSGRLIVRPSPSSTF